MIAAIEKATGGKSEVGCYSLDWKTMTAQVNGFVLHGTEPSGQPAAVSRRDPSRRR